jgi:hypothetical protein
MKLYLISALKLRTFSTMKHNCVLKSQHFTVVMQRQTKLENKLAMEKGKSVSAGYNGTFHAAR